MDVLLLRPSHLGSGSHVSRFTHPSLRLLVSVDHYLRVFGTTATGEHKYTD
jgi:hypothetical protein